MNYFDKTPSVVYGGRVAKNIVSKAQLSEETKGNKFNFYPYTMQAERSDNLSNKYYESPGYSWLIWLTNDIIDPYYQMPLTDEELREHIKVKYGSLEIAQRKIKCWRSNWYNDNTRLTPTQFDNLLYSHKKYYDPVLNNYLQVAEYKRKADSTLLNTNVIIELEVGPGYIVGEEVTVGSSYAAVSIVDGNYIIIENVVGLFNLGSTILGKTSGTTSIITQSTTLSTSLASSEASFWQPVTYFQYEQDLNEGRKSIKLLDNRFKNQADTELKRVMEL